MDAFDCFICDLDATSGLEVGGEVALSRNERINKNMRNVVNGRNSGGGIVNIP